MIQARGIAKAFLSLAGRRVETLKDLSLSVGKGEFVALVGPSGCGKTTLLKILCGLIAPDAGRVSLSGRSASQLKGRLGYLAQTDDLLPWLTVAGNVELGLDLQGGLGRRGRGVAKDWIERLGLQDFEECYPFELSGGMKKRVALMRTLAYDPDIIFMDEPFGALDVQTRDFIEDEVLRVWEETRKTIVLVTHDLSEAITLADRVVVMSARPGRIKREYSIPLPRPRTTEIRLEDKFNAIVREIWADLSQEVRKGRSEDDGSE